MAVLRQVITIVLLCGLMSISAQAAVTRTAPLFEKWIATDGGGVLNLENGELNQQFPVYIFYTEKKKYCYVGFTFIGTTRKGHYWVSDINCGLPAEHGSYEVRANVLDMKDSKTGSEYFKPKKN